MKIKLFKAMWGMETEGTLEQQFHRIAAAGYFGIESPIPDSEDWEQFKELLAKYQLEYIADIFNQGNHAESFGEQE